MWLAAIHVSCLSIKCVRLHGISTVLRGMSIASRKHLHLGLDPACIAEADENLVQDVLESMDSDDRHTYEMLREKGRLHHMVILQREGNGRTGSRRCWKRRRFLVIASVFC